MNLQLRLSKKCDYYSGCGGYPYSWKDTLQDIKLAFGMFFIRLGGDDFIRTSIHYKYNLIDKEQFVINGVSRFRISSSPDSVFYLLYGHVGRIEDHNHCATFILFENNIKTGVVLHFCTKDLSGKISQLPDLPIHEDKSTFYDVEPEPHYGGLILICRQKYVGIPKNKVFKSTVNLKFDGENFQLANIVNEMVHW